MPCHDLPDGRPPPVPPKSPPAAGRGLGTDRVNGSLGTEGAVSVKRDGGRCFEARVESRNGRFDKDAGYIESLVGLY